MLQMRVRKALFGFAVTVAAALGAAGPAQAAIVGAIWDPAYGAPFDAPGSVLGWEGSATWFLPDACLPGAGAFVANSNSCSNNDMVMLSATVNFYDYGADPTGDTSLLASLTFGPESATVYGMTLAGGVATGVRTGLSTSQTTSETFAGINNYEFALKFYDGNAYLFYAIRGSNSLSTSCAIGDISPLAGCGVNDPRMPAIATFTTTAVPEPQTYALMLAGLGIVGFMARRRRRI